MSTDTRTMGHRFPGQSVIEELLWQQSNMPYRSLVSRFLGRTPLSRNSISWYLGAKGELAVGALLSALPPDWAVFHALPVGTPGSDIDHLVVGPGGVFTINTKHHSGKCIQVENRTVMVAGQKVPYIRNSEFQAERVTSLLRKRMPKCASVQPVIALVDPKSIVTQGTPTPVQVVDARDLQDWLVTLPPVLDENERTELAAIVDSPETWSAAPEAEADDVMARFTDLDAEVRAAHVQRVLWAPLAIATMVGAAAAVALHFALVLLG